MPHMPNRNLVLVVDDDPGMLNCMKRLLRQHACKPILFSSAQAFKNHTDFESVACVILDINLQDGSGIELRHGLKANGISGAGYLHNRQRRPCRSRGCGRLWVHRISDEAILCAVAH